MFNPRRHLQCSSLRSEVTLMRQKLKSSESERERLQEELAAAHTRIDRLQSKTVAALNNTSKSTSSPNVSENGGAGISKKEEGSPTPSSPSVSGSVIPHGQWWEPIFLMHKCFLILFRVLHLVLL